MQEERALGFWAADVIGFVMAAAAGRYARGGAAGTFYRRARIDGGAGGIRNRLDFVFRLGGLRRLF
jgi:hypothetical protein